MADINKLIAMGKVKAEDFKPKPKAPEIVNISREEFNLLDAEEDNVIYYITEEDETITIKRGVNE